MSGANKFHILTEEEFIFRNALLKQPVLHYLQIPVAFLLLIYSKGELRAGSKCKAASAYCGADIVTVLCVCAH